MKKLFNEAIPVLDQLERAGFEAYFVGGAVRDYLIERAISDIDIATSAFPEEVKAVFQVTYDTGIKHGTVTIKMKGNLYEITTFRAEGKYIDFRRPSEVQFIRSLNEDLLRRDFTMNAIAMDKNFNLHDPFFGQADIKQKLIRAVGNPHARFREDALRMIRSVRFLSQLDFEIEEKTKKALIQEINLLSHTSVERIRVEWLKLLKGKAVKKALQVVLEVGMEKYLPGLKNKEKALFKLSQSNFEKKYTEEAIWLAQIITAQISETHHFLKKWKLSNQLIHNVTKAYSFYFLPSWGDYELYLAGPKIYKVVEEVKQLLGNKSHKQELDKRYEQLLIKNRNEMAITGNDILAFEGKKGGPWVKKLLEQTEKAIIERRVENNKNDIKRWLGYEER